MEVSYITLREALELGRLDEFVKQAEAEGVGPINADELDRALTRVITSPAGSRRASRSPDRGGSRGK